MQSNATAHLPRYVQYATLLEQQIVSGHYQTGSKLPSQRILAKQFDTTLMTIRQALDLLSERGVVRVEHGLGTFVADQQLDEEPFQLFSLGSTMRQRALNASTQVIEQQFESAYGMAAAALNLPSDAQLCLLKRLRLLNDKPFVLQRSYLAAQFKSIVQRFDGTQSLYETLREETGQPVALAREFLKPTVLAGRQARLLQRQKGEAAWLSVRISSLIDETPVIYDEAIICHDNLVLTVERHGGNAESALSWRDDESPAMLSYLLNS